MVYFKLIVSILILLIGFDIIKINSLEEKQNEWLKKYSLFIKIAGFILLVRGILELNII